MLTNGTCGQTTTSEITTVYSLICSEPSPTRRPRTASDLSRVNSQLWLFRKSRLDAHLLADVLTRGGIHGASSAREVSPGESETSERIHNRHGKFLASGAHWVDTRELQ